MSKWPSLDDYSEALYEPESAFKPGSRLRSANFVEQEFGHIYSSGTFAGIVRAKIKGENWAVRFLLRNQDAAEKRYAAISKLSKNQRKYLLDTEYLPKEIFIQSLNNHYPVILIKWVDGENLSEYLSNACKISDTEAIQNTAEMIREMRSYLRQHGIAHGDLSPENIMVTGKGKERKLVLVDYDSMYLPTISRLPCDVGRGKMQHPKRPEKPLPIGMWADEMAFLIYDAGLNALSKHPELGIQDGLFEQKFLVSVDELLSRSSPIIDKLHIDELNLFEKAANYAEGEYGAVTEVTESVPIRAAKTEQDRNRSEPKQKIRLYELAHQLQVKTPELVKLAETCGLPGKSNLSLLTHSEVQTLKTVFESTTDSKHQMHSLKSIAEELSLPIDLVYITACNKLKVAILIRSQGQQKQLVLSAADYNLVRSELYTFSPQYRFQNQFTYDISYLDALGIDLQIAEKIIHGRTFESSLYAPLSEHVKVMNGQFLLTQHALNVMIKTPGLLKTLEPLKIKSVEPLDVNPEKSNGKRELEPQIPTLQAITTETFGISRGDALIIINLDRFANALSAPRDKHVLVSGSEIKLSQHGLNTLLEINNLVGKSNEAPNTKSAEARNSPQDVPQSEATNKVATPAEIASKFGLSESHITDIMKSEKISGVGSDKYHLLEKIASEDVHAFPISEKIAAIKLNRTEPDIRKILEILSLGRWTYSIAQRPYGWRITEELCQHIAQSKEFTGNPKEMITVQKNYEAPLNAGVFSISLDQCATRFSISMQDLRDVLNSREFLLRLGEPLQSHTSVRRLRGSTRISDVALASLEYTLLRKNSNASPTSWWSSQQPPSVSTPSSSSSNSTSVKNEKRDKQPTLNKLIDRFPFTLEDCSRSLRVDVNHIRLALKSDDFLKLLGEPLKSHQSTISLTYLTGITQKAADCLEQLFSNANPNSQLDYKISKQLSENSQTTSPIYAGAESRHFLSRIPNGVLAFLLLNGPAISIVTLVLASLQMRPNSLIFATSAILAVSLAVLLILFRGFYINHFRKPQSAPQRIIGITLLVIRSLGGIYLAAFNLADLLRESPNNTAFYHFYNLQDRFQYLGTHVVTSSLIGLGIFLLFDLILFTHLFRYRIKNSNN